jgi:hypothetical protein
MPKSNDQLYQEAEEELYGRAIKETQDEIFADVMNIPEDENTGPNEGFETVESWDGSPLSLVEHAASMAGDTLYDRPLALNEDLELIDQVEELQNAVAERDAALNEIVNGPAARQAAREQFKERLWQEFGIMGVDDAKVDALREGLGEMMGKISYENDKAHRVNRAMHVARDEDPESFDVAYESLLRAGQSGDRQAVEQVWNSPNPGAALMNWHSGGRLGGDLGLAGVRNDAPRRGRQMPGREDIDRMPSGFGDADIEREIAESIW